MKQRLNTKSSTKTEFVGVDDALPHVLWTAYFLEAQGYKVKMSEVYQDNLSAMLLERNSKWSSGKRTKHINNEPPQECVVAPVQIVSRKVLVDGTENAF
eukprot:12500893-Ditylum_brightwellii.AAC.1